MDVNRIKEKQKYGKEGKHIQQILNVQFKFVVAKTEKTLFYHFKAMFVRLYIHFLRCLCYYI